MSGRKPERNEIESLDEEYTLGTWTRQRDFEPTQVVDTSGPRIVTADGDSILDFSSQYVCTSLGYDAERVMDRPLQPTIQEGLAAHGLAVPDVSLQGEHHYALATAECHVAVPQ